MNFNGSKFCLLQIGVVCLASCVLAQDFDLGNMLQNGQMQIPAEQPQLNFDTFSGPGSSVESEKNQPFNTLAAGTVGTDTATMTKPAEGVIDSTTNPTKIENQVVQPPVRPPRPDGKLPPLPVSNNQGSNGKLPKPLPGGAQFSPEMSPLFQLLKAILSKNGGGRFGGMQMIGGGPGSGFSPLEDGPMGGGFGGPSPFMGGPPRGGRVARIIILRKPRGGMGGGDFPGGFPGGFGGNAGGMGFMNQ